MKHLIAAIALTSTCIVAIAAPPADAPAGTMGKCKDGTYSSSDRKQGACKGHKGVAEWYESSTASSSPAPSPAAAATPSPPPFQTAPTNSAATAGRTSDKTGTTPAPGGGAGQVWVNSSSKVYHCTGDKWYGKTKAGEYMTEAAAKAGGNHPEHGKDCG